MGIIADLTGKKFGQLTVVKQGGYRTGRSGRKFLQWECICDCGNTVLVDANNLRTGNSTSCGCKTLCKDLTGLRFGKLVVIERAENSSRGDTRWRCLCDCGKETIVNRSPLISGATKSCGCGMLKALENGRRSSKTHGMSDTRLYRIWCGMKKRTAENADTRHKRDYYDRGIRMCEEWKNSFESFYKWAMSSGYEDGLSIDRIDNNGNYCPENCRWATTKQQSNNRRTNRRYQYNGEDLTISELAEKYGLNYNMLRERLIVLGWNIDRAMTVPPQSVRG